MRPSNFPTKQKLCKALVVRHDEIHLSKMLPGCFRLGVHSFDRPVLQIVHGAAVILLLGGCVPQDQVTFLGRERRVSNQDSSRTQI